MESTTSVVDAAKPKFQTIPVENIKPSSHQARKDFNPEELQHLADSMKEEGLIQPIVVRPVNDSFELVAGERRFRAAKMLQWPTIDAKVVVTVSEGEAAAKGLVENLQRQDLNPIEEAEGFFQLSQQDPHYWTQPQIAKVSGKTQGYISQSLKILGLPEPVKESIRRLILSRSHALELLSLAPEKQQEMADQVVKQGLSLKQTRQLVPKMLGKGEATKAPASPPPTYNAGGQAFTFTQKGSHLTIVTDAAHMDSLDVFMQNLRCAFIDYTSAQPKEKAPATA